MRLGTLLLLVVVCCTSQPESAPPESAPPGSAEEDANPESTPSPDPTSSPNGGGDEVSLSFTEASYTMKTGDLFNVTVEVEASDQLAAGSRVALKLLDEDGDEAGEMMQWQGMKEAMQPPEAAITAEVKDGKAVFDNLFIVDDKNVAILQAVLEHEGSALEAESELTSTAGGDKVTVLSVYGLSESGSSYLNLNVNPPPANYNEVSTDIYFFNANASPATVIGNHSGTGETQYIIDATKNAIKDTFCNDYRLAIKLKGKRAFYQSNVTCNN